MDGLTIDDMILALDQARNPHTFCRAESEHHQALNNARAVKRQAMAQLRYSASKSLLDEIGTLNSEIASERAALARYLKNEPRLAALEAEIQETKSSANLDATARWAWIAKRKEAKGLREYLKATDRPTVHEDEKREQIAVLASKSTKNHAIPDYSKIPLCQGVLSKVDNQPPQGSNRIRRTESDMEFGLVTARIAEHAKTRKNRGSPSHETANFGPERWV